MVMPGVYIDFGVEPSSFARLRDLQGRFASLDSDIRRQALIEQAAITREFLELVKHEFSLAHPGTGRTVKTFRAVYMGLNSSILLGGAAGFIAGGTDPHDITPSSASALVFPARSFPQREGSELVFAKYVNHPGYVGDPFVERAEARLNLRVRLNAIYNRAWRHMQVGSLGSTSIFHPGTALEMLPIAGNLSTSLGATMPTRLS